MASRAHDAGAVDAVLVLCRIERAQLEAFVEIAIAILDALDGDEDAEPEVDRCAGDDDHLGPVPARWKGVALTSADDDVGLCPIYGADQRRLARSEAAATRSFAAAQILRSRPRGRRYPP